MKSQGKRGSMSRWREDSECIELKGQKEKLTEQGSKLGSGMRNSSTSKTNTLLGRRWPRS